LVKNRQGQAHLVQPQFAVNMRFGDGSLGRGTDQDLAVQAGQVRGEGLDYR